MQLRNLLNLLLIVFIVSNCAQTIYVEDLSLRLEPLRTLEIRTGTESQIYKNNFSYKSGYYVFYNKNRVTWYTDRAKKDIQSMPLDEVYKIGYRSRTLGTAVGFVTGYSLGYLIYNFSVLNKPGSRFLGENNSKVTLTYGAIFAAAGFTFGFPIYKIFKYRKSETNPNLKWKIE